jgi:hypothetical protein
MAFKDLGDYVLDGASLRLPIGGKVYVVPPVPALVGLRAQTIMNLGMAAGLAADTGQQVGISEADKEILSDEDEKNLYADLLGTAYGEMMTDGVPWKVLKHAAVTAMIDCTGDRERAEAFWESLGNRPAPLDKKPPAARKSTAAARKSRPRGSTAGTTSRRS